MADDTQGLELRSLVTPEGELRLSLEEVTLAQPGPDEVLVRVEAAPLEFIPLDDGRVAVAAKQIVTNLQGRLWSDICVRHIYTFHEGRVARMDVADELNEA